MNIKDIIIVVGFALLTTWGLDHFILSRYRTDGAQEIKSGQSFNAPQGNRIIKPLNIDINFIDKKRVQPEVVTEVITEWGELTFSSEGAALERLEFAYGVNPHEKIITIYPTINRENKAFLVALEEKTPYYFNLVEKRENDKNITIVYEASFDDGVLRKQFAIAKQIHKIDVTIEVTLYNESSRAVQTRIFYPAPVMPDVKQDVIAGLVNNVKGSLEKTLYKNIKMDEGWWAPSVFGAENKYFVHALIADPDNFVERAYYTKTTEDQLISILEGRELQPHQKNSSWTISFYCGPKDAHAMMLVDERLEETLDYSGLLAPLSKLLLKILNFLYRYVYNYGFAILILTALIKLVMVPFAIRGERNIKKSDELQKKMNYLKQKYKNNPEQLRLEQVELLKKYGTSQILLGYLTFLPLLLQLPIFIALSRVLANSIELYKAPFIGWITNLSEPDPYYILPILIVLAMTVQALKSDPQQRMVMMGAAFFFGALSANFASGLVLYICASTLLGIVQTSLQKMWTA